MAENSQAQPQPQPRQDASPVFESDGVYGGFPYKVIGSKVEAFIAGRILRFPNMEAFVAAATRANNTPTETFASGPSARPLRAETKRAAADKGAARPLDPLRDMRDWGAVMGEWLASFLRGAKSVDNATTAGNWETSRKWDWLFGTWSSKIQRRLIGGVLLVIAIWIVLAILSDDKSREGGTGSHTRSGGSSFFHGHITEHDTLGCVKFEDWQELGQLAKNHEVILGSAAVIEKLATQACRILPVGTSVTVSSIEDVGLLSGSVCVRPEGEYQTECLWISMTRMDTDN
jgi:hypothetical protein